MSEKMISQNGKGDQHVMTPSGPRLQSKIQLVKTNEEVIGDRIVKKQSSKEFIITPGGPKKRSLVHHVEKDHILITENGRIVKKHISGRVVQRYGEVADKSTLLRKPLLPGNSLKKMVQVPQKAGGWISFSQFTNATGQTITQFETQWVVPPEPLTQSSQLIYLFNGLQNASKILQPVLQWGDNEEAGGNYLQVASWYAGSTASDSFHSDYVRVHPGDLLTGVMTLIGNTAGGFDYSCSFLGIPDTAITVRSQPELTMCFETLEVYEDTIPSEYPPVDFTSFFNINLQTMAAMGGNANPGINWLPVNTSLAKLGENTHIISNANPGGRVDIFYTNSPTNRFSPIYMQGDPGLGIGGYDLLSDKDRSFAFDYESSGFTDHIALFRPGSGAIFIIKNTGRNQALALPTPPLFTFTPVYAEGDQGRGIGGYDLKSDDDKAFGFDYGSAGKLDHIVLYRPGAGVIFILKNNAGNFQQVLQSFNGIGGYDLQSTDDKVFAFDYNGSGLQDHLVLYRPGGGVIFILKNNGGNFQPVLQSFNGIGGYDLLSADDKIFPFDYDGSGLLDHFVLYRPGAGVLFILKNISGNFQPVFQSFTGVGGYDLLDQADLVFPFDFNRSGNADHLVFYRPGTGTVWILRNVGGAFVTVYQQGAPGNGIGGYNMADQKDLIFSFDYDRSGLEDHLCCYRPGTGTFWILKKS